MFDKEYEKLSREEKMQNDRYRKERKKLLKVALKVTGQKKLEQKQERFCSVLARGL